MKTALYLTFLLSTGSALATSLTGTENGVITDAQLKEAAQGPGYVFYKNSPEWLRFTPRGGGHAGWIRIRFNDIAAAALGADGKLPEGTEFPAGSIVVKEIKDQIYDTESGHAIMVKAPNATNANKAWVWGEYEADDSIIVSAASAGRSCIRCHSATQENSPVSGDQGHRDYVRTFGLRP